MATAEPRRRRNRGQVRFPRQETALNVLGLNAGEFFAVLAIGISPIRVTLAFMPIAATLKPEARRMLAARTVTGGLAVSVLIVVAGGAIARNFAPRLELIEIGAGLILVSTTLASLAREPGPAAGASAGPAPDLRALALWPLAVPTLINPVGVALLFSVAAYAATALDRLIFLGIVVGMLAVSYGLMLLTSWIATYFTRSVLSVIHEIFSLLVTAFGAKLILVGLAGLHVLTVR